MLGGQLLPTIGIETEARAAHTALVHEIISALGSALVRRLGNHPGAYPTTSLNREHAPMNMRGDTIATSAPTRHTHALPAATGHRQWKGTTPAAIRTLPPSVAAIGRRTLEEPEMHCDRYETTHRGATVARSPRRPPADEETTRHHWDRLTPPEAP